jgi:hypothetical protein
MELFLRLFPFLHFTVLIAGGIILFFLKKRYPRLQNFELIVVFLLFLTLMAIFTEPGLDLLKRFISLIQLD